MSNVSKSTWLRRERAVGKLLRYGVASGVALGVDVGVMWCLHFYFGYHYLLAAALGFASGCAITYLISKLYIFQDNSERHQAKTALLFVLVGVFGLGINHGVLFIGVDVLNFQLIVAKAISAGIVFMFNFLLRGKLVFKDPDLIRT